MKKLIIITLFFLLIESVYAQDNKIMRYYSRLDSATFLFIDNTTNCWFTIEINTDTLVQIQNDIFYADNKIIQIISSQFGIQLLNGQFVNIIGNQNAEKRILRAHKKWELDYQQKAFGGLKNKGEIFYGKENKPFSIWWIENPKNWRGEKIGFKTKIQYEDFDSNNEDPSEFIITQEKRKSTHQVWLDFMIHGKTCISISIPVLDDESLLEEIVKLKQIANSLNVYGHYIDPKILFERIDNPNYIFKDSLNLIEFEVPKWLNITANTGTTKDAIYGTFPEKDNITNAVGIVWRAKSDSLAFNKSKNHYLGNVDKGSLTIISKEKNKEQYFFTRDNGWFHCQTIFIEGENAFCMITFTATESTYQYNLKRFYDLIDKIKVK